MGDPAHHWNYCPRVAERGPVDADTFRREVLTAQQPVVLRGQVADWPLVQSGAEGPEAFCRHLLRFDTGAPVAWFDAPPEVEGRYGYSPDLAGFNFERREAPLFDLLQQLQQALDVPRPPGLYAGAIPLPRHLPGLAKSHDHGLLPPGEEQLVSLWLGNRGRTAAHFDLPQNLACVLRGQRRFILMPITALPDLYLGPLDFTLAGQPISLVDFHCPDLERFPRFERAAAEASVADLGPGDVIYLPSLWFHHVENRDSLGALMNFWWRDAPDHMITPMITLFHGLLSLRGLPPGERAAWREVFDHFLFSDDGEAMAHLPENARGLFGEMTPEKLARLKTWLAQSLGLRDNP